MGKNKKLVFIGESRNPMGQLSVLFIESTLTGETTMSNSFDKLPSVRSMMKLILILLLALVAFSLVVAIVKVLMPLAIIVALVVGGYYLYQRLQANGSKA